LQDANLPWEKVVKRAAGNSIVRDRVESADIIIWDEASMSSQRVFELVNALHHELANDEITKQRPFGGKQIVLVGEFLQLKPVPSLFDNGNFMFTSPLFASSIPHRFELTQNMRQSDPKFLFCISEIRMGKCSKETELFLQKDLSTELEKDATHIFFRKVNAQLFNNQKITELSSYVQC
jgi:ATP-dependent DNA helicase PIF1